MKNFSYLEQWSWRNAPRVLEGWGFKKPRVSPSRGHPKEPFGTLWPSFKNMGRKWFIIRPNRPLVIPTKTPTQSSPAIGQRRLCIWYVSFQILKWGKIEPQEFFLYKNGLRLRSLYIESGWGREGGFESERDPLMPILTSRTEAIISACNSCALQEQTSTFWRKLRFITVGKFCFYRSRGHRKWNPPSYSGLRTQDSGPRPLLLELGVQKVDCRGVLCA
jgi:hypothetical protein